VKAIVADYLSRDSDRLVAVDYGYELDADDQRRRYLLQSILNADGLDAGRYSARFGTDPADDFPDLRTFADLGLLSFTGTHWLPTPAGLERSDTVGPWFFSPRARRLTAEYQPR
jgi:oxygen-independent coproporphyrinogen-3 oxidase